EYPEAYDEIERIGFAVLDSGAVDLRDEFDWEFHLIDDDDTLNAFCAPGGYVWVYTGLIKYVDSEDTLAGVLGHEIGHADNRHTTEQLTEVYGVQVLLEVALGER